MTNQLITNRLPIDYSLISLMSLMSSIRYVWSLLAFESLTLLLNNDKHIKTQSFANPMLNGRYTI